MNSLIEASPEMLLVYIKALKDSITLVSCGLSKLFPNRKFHLCDVCPVKNRKGCVDVAIKNFTRELISRPIKEE